MTSTAELLHFAVLDIGQVLQFDGILIYCETNNPCHLYLYWTNIPPKRHKRSRVVRGLIMSIGAYWCFDTYQRVEQREDGDTHVHSFDLSPWPICETRWFLFRGTINNVWSLSAGPIFEKHYQGAYTFIKNPSFEDWPDPLQPPTYWAWTSPSHPNTTLTRDSLDKTHGNYSARMDVTGELGWYRIYQDVDAIPLRGKWIQIRAAMKGAPIYYTGLWVSIDGTPPFYKQETPASADYWADGDIIATVKANSTKIHIELRVDHFSGQPNTCRFDNLRSLAA